MAAAKRSSSSIWQTGKWDGLRSDCIATRAKGIYAAHCTVRNSKTLFG